MKGNQLIYQCKRCQSKNVIYYETRRQTQFKLIKKKRSIIDTSNINLKPIHSVCFNNKKLVNTDNISNAKLQTEKVKNYPRNNSTGKKKFSSLQLKLKQSEIDQEKHNNEKVSSSIFDFLKKLY